jgi:hypothetical protein
MPRYTAVLDACVLVPVALADTLLRVAEKGLYLWVPNIRRPTRPGNIRGSGPRDGHGAGPGHLLPEQVDADVRQARAGAALDVAGASCNDRDVPVKDRP